MTSEEMPFSISPSSASDAAKSQTSNTVPSDSQKQASGKRRSKKRKRSNTSSPEEDTQWHTPWLDTLGMTEYESMEQRLHDEIVSYVNYVDPTDHERRARELVISRVRELIKRRFTSCTVTVFGSVAQDLCLPDGDIDLAIQTPQVYDEKYRSRALFQLSSMLKNAGFTARATVASGARVPVLTMQTLPSLGSLNIDININASDGIKAIQIIKDYLTKMPALRQLVLVVKGYLSKRGLNSAATGGLGSYAILCLVICFLKVNPKGRPSEYLEKPMESESLGTLIMDFFDYYGNEFPYSTSYVSPAKGKVLSKESMGWQDVTRPTALSIDCLISPGRDIGKPTSRVAQIRTAFQAAYDTIRCYPFSIQNGNILGTILGISDQTMNHRKHIEYLVTSGSLEKDLAALVLPPVWVSSSNTGRKYSPAPRGPYRPVANFYGSPHYIRYPPHSGGFITNGGFAPPYPGGAYGSHPGSYGYNSNYLNYGSPSPDGCSAPYNPPIDPRAKRQWT